MATGGEIKKLLRPLLARRPDLLYSRRTIFCVPFTRYLRGVTFVLPAYSRSTPIACFANQLCDGSHGLNAASFETARIPADWEDDVEATSRWLCDEVEREILPKIEPVTSFEEHLKRFPESLRAYKVSDGSRGIDFQFACNACTHGDFEQAEAAMIELLDPKIFILGVPKVVTEEHRFSLADQERMAYFLMTLRKGKTKVLTLLHEWEAFSVKSLKLEKYWQPSPFPCEL